MIILLFVPLNLAAQRVAGRFSTSLYTFEKFDTAGSSRTIARAFQTIYFDVSEGDVSFTSSLYGVTNVSQSFGNDAAIRVTNFFLKWKRIGNVMDLQAGRVPVFAGVGNGTVDGVLLKVQPQDSRFTLLGYGGANVRADLTSRGFDDLSRNFFLGGQLIANFQNGFRLSFSYANKHIQREEYTARRPDSLFNPVSITVIPDSRADQAVGVDTRFDGNGCFSAYGRYDYDVNFKRSRRAELNARLVATNRFAFTGSYIYREPRLQYNSFFGVFPVSPVREYEGGIEYTPVSTLRTYGRFAYVQYHDDMSRRISAGLYFDYGSASFSGTNGYAGQLSSFEFQGMYPLLDRRLIPTLGFSFAAYRLDEGIHQRQDIFAGTLGAVVRPVPQISGDFQVQWLRNKVAENDVRLYVKLNYWFSHNLRLFRQEGADD